MREESVAAHIDEAVQHDRRLWHARVQLEVLHVALASQLRLSRTQVRRIGRLRERNVSQLRRSTLLKKDTEGERRLID